MRRILSCLLAAVMAANGLAMLAAGRWWYGAVPGVTETGPYNPHFVKDIGAAYLVVGAAFARLAWRGTATAKGACVAAAAFLALHGLVHIADAVADPAGAADLVRDFPGVFLPALVAVWLAWPTSRKLETSHA
jgi:hypothetical protein